MAYKRYRTNQNRRTETIHPHAQELCHTTSIRSKTSSRKSPTAASHSPTQNPFTAYSVHEIKLWGYRCLHRATQPNQPNADAYHTTHKSHKYSITAEVVA
ncbi:hypothetical protein BO83DRAFT_128192 [Aspergillus eucalypticola CBS 122712]|uniref:Uncharacterized protein n=1 Tax=Aspergillus eucalypticola (strain CBS 122712 / IBT 29274) TaxID=1448314 RepID=A0A317USD9_ASPEC|nr:uncharacterized protein BO83DRAFT_128192 [Aspergillus eucalypticola CBS 122712]PWY64953.1 hypothetical protein BO83DRAFT_128192 [Aspergillus eucalypticola CBS 122712]